MEYAKKAVLFVITAVLGTNVTEFALNGEFRAEQWWTIGITVLGAALVFVKENTATDPHAKYWIALFVPVALAVQGAISDSNLTAAEVAPILIALFGAFQVKAAGNVGDNYDKGPAAQIAA